MNAKQHRVICTFAGAAFSTIQQLLKMREDETYEFSFGNLFLHAGAGYTLASLPDWLEPASRGGGHHRKFLHSLTAGGCVAWGAYGKHSKKWPANVKEAVRAVANAYLSHLAADATTPRGLAVIHPKFL